MVKFSQNDPVYAIVVEKLAKILSLGETIPDEKDEAKMSNLEINNVQTIPTPQNAPSEGLNHEGECNTPD